MFGGECGDARPNNEDEEYGRRDDAQNDVVSRNVGGGREGSGSVVVLFISEFPTIESSRFGCFRCVSLAYPSSIS